MRFATGKKTTSPFFPGSILLPPVNGVDAAGWLYIRVRLGLIMLFTAGYAAAREDMVSHDSNMGRLCVEINSCRIAMRTAQDAAYCCRCVAHVICLSDGRERVLCQTA